MRFARWLVAAALLTSVQAQAETAPPKLVVVLSVD